MKTDWKGKPTISEVKTMIKNILYVLLALIPYQGYAQNHDFVSGEDLIVARVEYPLEFQAYVSAIMEGHLVSAFFTPPQLICVPPETTRKEMADAAALYLLQQPKEDLQEFPARVAAFAALMWQYPCDGSDQ